MVVSWCCDMTHDKAAGWVRSPGNNPFWLANGAVQERPREQKENYVETGGINPSEVRKSKMWTAVDFCPDPKSAFEEVLAVPVVVPEQTKMTSKSTTLESGSTPYRMNRSVEIVGSQKCTEGRKSKSSVR